MKIQFAVSVALAAFGATVSIASGPARATQCFTPYTNASAGTPGPVCADIQLTGFHEGDPLSVTTSPLPAWGNSVSITGGGGGTGINGLVAVSGTLGEGHIKAESHIEAPRPDQSQVSARGFLGFADTFTVGASNVQANFVSSLSGSFSGAGSGQAVLRVQDLGNFAVAIDDLKTLVNESLPASTKQALVTLTANHQYSLSWMMTALADSNVGGASFDHPDVTADLSGTGHLNIDIVTPGGMLTFASGHNYSSTAVTPLPPSSTMMLLALGALGLLCWTRRGAQRVPSAA